MLPIESTLLALAIGVSQSNCKYNLAMSIPDTENSATYHPTFPTRSWLTSAQYNRNLPQTYIFLFTFCPRGTCVQYACIEAQRPHQTHALSRSWCCLGLREGRLSRWTIFVEHGARLLRVAATWTHAHTPSLPETVLTSCTRYDGKSWCVLLVQSWGVRPPELVFNCF